MHFPQLLTKSVDTPTPLLLKVGVVLLAWVSAAPLPRALEAMNVLQLVTSAVPFVVLVAIWNLKRWAVLAYAAIAIPFVVGSALKFGTVAIRGIALGIVLHLLVIGPALAYWRRMTWV